jgi:hypothetical protein
MADAQDPPDDAALEAAITAVEADLAAVRTQIGALRAAAAGLSEALEREDMAAQALTVRLEALRAARAAGCPPAGAPAQDARDSGGRAAVLHRRTSLLAEGVAALTVCGTKSRARLVAVRGATARSQTLLHQLSVRVAGLARWEEQ